MDNKEKTRTLKKWFNCYKELFINLKDKVTDEQIEAYNEMARLVGEVEYKRPTYKYEKVLVNGQYVMKEIIS